MRNVEGLKGILEDLMVNEGACAGQCKKLSEEDEELYSACEEFLASYGIDEADDEYSELCEDIVRWMKKKDGSRYLASLKGVEPYPKSKKGEKKVIEPVRATKQNKWTKRKSY